MYKNFIEIYWDVIIICTQNACKSSANVIKSNKESEERNSEVLKVQSSKIKRNRTI